MQGLPSTGPIQSEEEAQEIQDSNASAMCQTTAGWKMGAFDTGAQQRLGLTRPFTGRVFSSRLLYGAEQTPVYLATAEVHIEVEVAFRLSRDLPARDGMYSFATVSRAINGVVLALEIVSPRKGSVRSLSGLEIIADNGCCDGLVVGSVRTDWKRLEVAGLPLELTIGQAAKVSGRVGLNTNELVRRVWWLVNFLSRRGTTMHRGQFVATGTWTGLRSVPFGSLVEATCHGLGSMSVLVAGVQ